MNRHHLFNALLCVALVFNFGAAAASGHYWTLAFCAFYSVLLWLSAFFAAKPSDGNPICGAFVTFVVWCQWKMLGIRRVDTTAFAEMIEEGADYVCIPIDLWTTKNGTLVVTQALVAPVEEKEAWQP